MSFIDVIGSMARGVCKFVSSVASGISSFAKSVVSGVGKAIELCSQIGGKLASAVGCVGNTLGPWWPVIFAVIKEVLKAVFKDTQEEPVALGQAAAQVKEKPENFNSIEEYIAHLREEIRSGRVNIKKEEELDDDERIKYEVMGVGIGMLRLGEKYNIDIKDTTEFVRDTINCGLTAKEIAAVIDRYKNGSIKDVADYLENREISSGAEKSSVSANIKEAISQASPALNTEEQVKRFNEILAERSNLEKELNKEMEKHK